MANREFEIEVNGFAFGGAGVGVLPNGKVCFVRGAAPGELVRVEVTDERAKFAYARLISVLKPCRDRIEPECPLAIGTCDDGARCPGCSYAHVNYETELYWKQKQLESFLVRSGLVDKSRVRPPVGAGVRLGWRNKIRLSAGKDANGNKVLGYRGADNETIIDVPDCLLARRGIREAIKSYRIGEPAPGARHVTFRCTLRDGVIVRPNTEETDSEFLCEQVGHHGNFAVGENSFFQVNVPMAAQLAEAVTEKLKTIAPDYLVELYCGVGVFSLIAADEMENLKVAGVELDRIAIQAARINAKRRKMAQRCHYVDGDAARMLRDASRGMPAEQTAVLVDPPRSGLAPEMTKAILGYAPRALLYVSCAPDTLKRDLELLRTKYEPCDVQLFDLFPATAHFESLTVLRRKY